MDLRRLRTLVRCKPNHQPPLPDPSRSVVTDGCMSPTTCSTQVLVVELEAARPGGPGVALSRCEIKIVMSCPPEDSQAAATASRHVVIATARKTRCD